MYYPTKKINKLKIHHLLKSNIFQYDHHQRHNKNSKLQQTNVVSQFACYIGECFFKKNYFHNISVSYERNLRIPGTEHVRKKVLRRIETKTAFILGIKKGQTRKDGMENLTFTGHTKGKKNNDEYST